MTTETYWNENGRYQANLEKLENLVPGSGPAETFKGELFRAASRIYYDYYNNGFGNTWEGPARLLMTYVKFPNHIKDLLEEHMSGEICHTNCDEDIEEMMDLTIQALLVMPETPNNIDMWEIGKYV